MDNIMHRLRAATLAARMATGDKRISTQIKQQRINIVVVTKREDKRGTCDVRVIAEGLTFQQATDALIDMALKAAST